MLVRNWMIYHVHLGKRCKQQFAVTPTTHTTRWQEDPLLVFWIMLVVLLSSDRLNIKTTLLQVQMPMNSWPSVLRQRRPYLCATCFVVWESQFPMMALFRRVFLGIISAISKMIEIPNLVWPRNTMHFNSIVFGKPLMQASRLPFGYRVGWTKVI